MLSLQGAQGPQGNPGFNVKSVRLCLAIIVTLSFLTCQGTNGIPGTDGQPGERVRCF